MRSKFKLIISFVSRFKAQTLLVFFALFVAGMFEGLSIISILPVLNIAFESSAQPSEISIQIQTIFDYIGIKPELSILMIIVISAVVFKSIIHMAAMTYVGYVASYIATDIRLRLIRAVLNAKWEYFAGQSIGKLTNSIGMESAKCTTLYMAICQIASAMLQVIILLTLAMFVSVKLTVLAIIVGIVMLFLLGGFVKMAQSAGHKTSESFKNLSAEMTDSLQGIKPIKAMGLEKEFAHVMEYESHELNRSHRQLVLAKHGQADLREPIIIIFLLGGIFYSITALQLPMSELMLMAILFYRAVNIMGNLQGNYQSIGTTQSFYKSISQQIENAVSNAEDFSGKEEVSLNQGICFNEVGFSYSNKTVFNRLSFTITANSLTAIIGPSGSGKTTIADLITGMYEAESGNIFIDNVEIHMIDIAAWRRKIGYVPQDNLLLNDTIYANIKLNDPAITESDVVTSLKMAGAWEFVSSRKDGIFTIVGERGAKLSGGQKQRLSIARALVRKPILLIMDEATTALDPETEKEIIETIQNLKNELTIIAISHQPAIVAVADKVIRLDKIS